MDASHVIDRMNVSVSWLLSNRSFTQEKDLKWICKDFILHLKIVNRFEKKTWKKV